MRKQSPLLRLVLDHATEKSRSSGKIACLFESFVFEGIFIGLALRDIVPSGEKNLINPGGTILEREGIIAETLPSNKFVLIITPSELLWITTKTLYSIYICLAK